MNDLINQITSFLGPVGSSTLGHALIGLAILIVGMIVVGFIARLIGRVLRSVGFLEKHNLDKPISSLMI